MRLLTMLLLIGGLIAGYFLLMQNRQERESRYHVGQLKPYLESLVGPATAKGATPPDEAALFKLLFFLHKSETNGVNIDEMISSTCNEMGLSEGVVSLVKDGIRANFEQANKFRLFDELENALKLENGEPALIKSPGWKDEPVAVAQIVSPLLAPEAAQNIANLQLVPAAVRDVMDEATSMFIADRARIFETNHLITRESLDRVRAAHPSSK